MYHCLCSAGATATPGPLVRKNVCESAHPCTLPSPSARQVTRIDRRDLRELAGQPQAPQPGGAGREARMREHGGPRSRVGLRVRRGVRRGTVPEIRRGLSQRDQPGGCRRSNGPRSAGRKHARPQREGSRRARPGPDALAGPAHSGGARLRCRRPLGQPDGAVHVYARRRAGRANVGDRRPRGDRWHAGTASSGSGHDGAGVRPVRAVGAGRCVAHRSRQPPGGGRLRLDPCPRDGGYRRAHRRSTAVAYEAHGVPSEPLGKRHRFSNGVT